MTTHAIDEVFEVVNFIKDNMATKSEVVELSNDFNEFRVETRGEFRELRRELADINNHLDRLDTAVADVRGYAKEIDALRSRLNDIERHLGLSRPITA